MGRVRKQPDAGPDETGKKFPPRKRSIPYGFDFDLDEVWAPNNPHLKHLKNVNSSREKNKQINKMKPSSFSGSQVQSCAFCGIFYPFWAFFGKIRISYSVAEEEGGQRQGVAWGLLRVRHWDRDIQGAGHREPDQVRPQRHRQAQQEPGERGSQRRLW